MNNFYFFFISKQLIKKVQGAQPNTGSILGESPKKTKTKAKTQELNDQNAAEKYTDYHSDETVKRNYKYMKTPEKILRSVDLQSLAKDSDP